MTEQMQSAEEMRDRLVDKATVDSDFRAELVSNPRSAINAELGIRVPEDIKVVVHESDENTFHLALPPAELSEEQLEAIAAGRCCCCL